MLALLASPVGKYVAIVAGAAALFIAIGVGGHFYLQSVRNAAVEHDRAMQDAADITRQESVLTVGSIVDAAVNADKTPQKTLQKEWERP